MTRRSPESLLWLLFSAGGTAAALLVPVLLFLFGVAFPLGWIPDPGYTHLLSVLRHPVAKVILFGLCVLCLFHWAHRFRYTLYDGLQLKPLSKTINLFCYGGAAAGSVAAGYVLFSV
ncbi:fumarate reductase subunit FrdD [Streptomyces sannanensis]|uniref:Fumarate reductase subunit FrdD n=1 Tax=Streptomyces sannanensis TaxID=285536 RepID=A0ABP6SKW2_9ACTN